MLERMDTIMQDTGTYKGTRSPVFSEHTTFPSTTFSTLTPDWRSLRVHMVSLMEVPCGPVYEPPLQGPRSDSRIEFSIACSFFTRNFPCTPTIQRLANINKLTQSYQDLLSCDRLFLLFCSDHCMTEIYTSFIYDLLLYSIIYDLYWVLDLIIQTDNM